MIHCSTTGICSMENRNPESRKAGRNVISSAIWLAANWFLASTEMKNPSDSTTIMNSAELTASVRNEPRNGTWNQ